MGARTGLVISPIFKIPNPMLWQTLAALALWKLALRIPSGIPQGMLKTFQKAQTNESQVLIPDPSNF
jgi:hypothetical protein